MAGRAAGAEVARAGPAAVPGSVMSWKVAAIFGVLYLAAVGPLTIGWWRTERKRHHHIPGIIPLPLIFGVVFVVTMIVLLFSRP